MVGKIKNKGEELLITIKFFYYVSNFSLSLIKPPFFLEISRTCLICGDMLGNRPRGYSCFLLAGDMLGNAPSRSPLLFGHFPKCIHYSVKVAEKVSNTLWAFPKESPIPLTLIHAAGGVYDFRNFEQV
jgi:hypothetical protein